MGPAAIAARDEGARRAAIRLSASATSLVPAIPAGSAAGPISTKSLYITPRRGPP